MNTDYLALIREKEWGVILFTASWARSTEICRRFDEAARRFSDSVNFCKVDVDAVPDLAQECKIGTVPTIAYFRDGELIDTVVGEYQQVTTEIETLMEGDVAWSERRKLLSIFR